MVKEDKAVLTKGEVLSIARRRLVKGSMERQDWLAKAGDCRKRSFSSSLLEGYSAGVETRKGSPRRMEEWTKRKGWGGMWRIKPSCP